MPARLKSLILFATALALSTGCITTQGAFTLPTRTDISPVAMSNGSEVVNGTHVAIGAHWASISPNPKTPVNVGLGYIVETYEDGTPAAEGRMPGGPAPADSPEGDDMVLHGSYLEFGGRISGNRWRRSWLSLRGELLWRDVRHATLYGTGLTARADYELIYAAMAGGNGGGMIGAFGLGLYLETSYRKLPGNRRATAVTSGVSIRLPLLGIGG